VGFFATYRQLYPVSRDVLRGAAEQFQCWVKGCNGPVPRAATPRTRASATRCRAGRSWPGDAPAIPRHSRDGSRALRPRAHSANAPTRSHRGRLRRPVQSPVARSDGKLPVSARRFSQAIWSLPPLGIASRAFKARFRIASASWFGSTHAGRKLGSALMSSRISGPMVCLRIFSASSTTAETSGFPTGRPLKRKGYPV
jgi:hypothetical protein